MFHHHRTCNWTFPLKPTWWTTWKMECASSEPVKLVYLSIISCYQFCKDTTSGPKTAYSPQWSLLQNSGVLHPDPRRQFIEDLDKLLNKPTSSELECVSLVLRQANTRGFYVKFDSRYMYNIWITVMTYHWNNSLLRSYRSNLLRNILFDSMTLDRENFEYSVTTNCMLLGYWELFCTL